MRSERSVMLTVNIMRTFKAGTDPSGHNPRFPILAVASEDQKSANTSGFATCQLLKAPNGSGPKDTVVYKPTADNGMTYDSKTCHDVVIQLVDKQQTS